MGETFLHVTSPEVYSKRFSDYVKQFHAEEDEEGHKDERRHKNKTLHKNVRDAAIKQKGRGNNPRRLSESSMLPPINTTTGISTPSFSNGVWKFQGTSPGHLRSNMKANISIAQSLLAKESQNSRHPPKDEKTTKTFQPNISSDVRKSPETLRLTPIVSTDRKSKSDKKLSNKSPNGNSPRLATKASHEHHKNKTKVSKNQKLKPFDEPFSIRKKIEQFKRWHEEQYLMKLQKLKQNTEIKVELPKRKSSVEKEASTPKLKMTDKEGPLRPKTENETFVSCDEADSGNGSAFNLSSIMKSTASRHKSAKTWRTWRDVNDSYAYTDVAKYIEDNELMTPEKENWIKKWAEEVDRAYFQNASSSKHEPLQITETD